MTQITLNDWEKKGKYFTYNGHKIFYVDEGDLSKPNLVFIHGYPTSSYDWFKVWRELRTKFRLFAFDMIGFGFSDKPKKYKYSIHDQAELTEKLLINIGISDAHIFAHDYGDTVAQEVLARYEDRQRESGGKYGLKIHSLCFLNGGLFPETHHAKPIQKLLLGPFGSLIIRMYDEKKFRKTFSEIFGPNSQPTEQEYEDLWHLINHKGGKMVLHKLITYIKDRRQHRERWVQALQQTKVPLRVIDGAFDPVSGKHMVDRYRELVPNPDTVLLDNIGHYPQVEAPEEVLKHYFEFVDKLLVK